MTFSISYDATYVDGSMSVGDFLSDWAANYNETYYCQGEEIYNCYGGFWTTGSGDKNTVSYSVGSTDNGMTGFVAEGEWMIDPETYVFTDSMNALSFGQCLALDAYYGFYLESMSVSFSGLAEIISDASYVIYNLLNGNVGELLQQLEMAGIDTSASLDSYAETVDIASQLDIIGVPDTPDTLLAA